MLKQIRSLSMLIEDPTSDPKQRHYESFDYVQKWKVLTDGIVHPDLSLERAIDRIQICHLKLARLVRGERSQATHQSKKQDLERHSWPLQGMLVQILHNDRDQNDPKIKED